MAKQLAAAAAALEPSLPYPDCGPSYWHRTTRGFAYLNLNSTSPVHASSEYVIIGSGISGALTAFQLLEAGIGGGNIVILEAREAVSGSSGRNAGHVRPDAFRNFSAYAAVHGVVQALKIVENENHVLKLVDKFVKEHHVPCDFHLKPTFDVNFTSEVANDEAKNVKEYVDAGGSMAGISVYNGEEAKQKTGFADAMTAFEWTAASIHPAKLAQWLLSSVIERGVHLWTHCPAISINPGKEKDWIVQTPRGYIRVQNVVHCTNAYAGLLLPQLSGHFLTPIRVQVHSLVPSTSLTGDHAIKSSMALRYGLQNFYALTQMENDGTVIFGVARPSGITFDESTYNEDIIEEALEKFNTLFSVASKEGEVRNGEVLDAWTGLIAITPDKVPYIGPISELPGQYICAGFNGHGMANIFTCAPGVVRLMLGGAWEDTKLPECYRYSRERLV